MAWGQLGCRLGDGWLDYTSERPLLDGPEVLLGSSPPVSPETDEVSFDYPVACPLRPPQQPVGVHLVEPYADGGLHFLAYIAGSAFCAFDSDQAEQRVNLNIWKCTLLKKNSP